MASVGEGDCHKDPNFAVICSCLDKYGESLGLPSVSYLELKKYLEDTSVEECRVLIDIHVRLLRRIGKSSVTADRFEKSIVKFCHHFSEFDAWEVESYGYRHAQISTKLRILKNLLECQFDYNVKFKEKVNESSAEDMRFLPIGRDKEGQAYWYFVDKDNNLMVYKEEQDDEDADTWQLICSDRQELADLVETLQKDAKTEVKEEDDKSTSVSRSSKEGTPDKELPPTTEQQSSKEECKTEGPGPLQKQNVDIKQEVSEEAKDETLPSSDSSAVCKASQEEEVSVVSSVETDKVEAEIKVEGVCASKVSEHGKKKPGMSSEEVKITECETTDTQAQSTSGTDPKERNEKEVAILVTASDQVSHSTEVPQVLESDPTIKESEFETEALPAKPDESPGTKQSDKIVPSSPEEGTDKNLESTKDDQSMADVGNEEKTSNTQPESASESSRTEAKGDIVESQSNADEKPEMENGVSEGKDSLSSLEKSKGLASEIDQASSEIEKHEAGRVASQPGNVDESSSTLPAAVESKGTSEDLSKVPQEVDMCEGSSNKEKSDEASLLTNTDLDGVDKIHKKDGESSKKRIEESQTTEQIEAMETEGERADQHEDVECPESHTIRSQDQTSPGVEEKTEEKQLEQTCEEKTEEKQQPSQDSPEEVSLSSHNDEGSKTEPLTSGTSISVDVGTKEASHSESLKIASIKRDVEDSKDVGRSVVSPPGEDDHQTSESVHEKHTRIEVGSCSPESPYSVPKHPPDKECGERLEGKSNSASCPDPDTEPGVATVTTKVSNTEIKGSEKDRTESAGQDVDEKLQETQVVEETGDREKPQEETNREQAEVSSNMKKDCVDKDMAASDTICNSTGETVKSDMANGPVVNTSAIKPAADETPCEAGGAIEDDSSVDKQIEIPKDSSLPEIDQSGKMSPGDAEKGSKDVAAEDSEPTSQIESSGKAENIDKQEAENLPREEQGDHLQVYPGQGTTQKSKEEVDLEGKVVNEKTAVGESKTKEDIRKLEGEEGKKSSEGEKVVNERVFPEGETDEQSLEDKTLVRDKDLSANKELGRELESEGKEGKITDDGEAREESTQPKQSVEDTSSEKYEGSEKGEGKDEHVKKKVSKNMETKEDTSTNVSEGKDRLKQDDSNLHSGTTEKNMEGLKQSEGTDDVENSKDIVDSDLPVKNKDGNEHNNDGLKTSQDTAFNSDKSGEIEKASKAKEEGEHFQKAAIDLDQNGEIETIHKQNEDKCEKSTVNLDKEGGNENVSEPNMGEVNISKEAALNSEKEKEISKDDQDKGEKSQEVTVDSGKEKESDDVSKQNKGEENKLQEASVYPEQEEKREDVSENDKEEVGKFEATVNVDQEEKNEDVKKQDNDDREKSPKAAAHQHQEEKEEDKNKDEGEKDYGRKTEVVLDPDSKKKDEGANKEGCKKEAESEKNQQTPENSSKPPEVEGNGKSVPSETPPSRKLKRAAPGAGSDEPQDMTQPDGKRARQTARVQRTRGGRNAAARGRAARQLMATGSESEDSEAPSSRGRRGRGRGGRNVRGRGRKVARGGGKNISEDANAPSAAVTGEEDAGGDVATQEKRAKKKKPDSSSEALSGEEVTPAKKGRNQTQAAPRTPRGGGGRGKRGGRGRGRGNSKAVAVSSPCTEESNLRRSTRVKQARARRPPSSPSEESSEETEEETDEEEEERKKDFLDASFTPEEESGDEDFKPKGRNFQRQEARTIKEQNEECVNDDTPCLKCGKYNHPEMILLCDKCDAGYHTACLRPPLMLIPDGDWFCPPCEHSFLVTRLLECLQALDLANKKKDRLNKRQERLAYVGINIGNILQAGERKVSPSDKFGVKEEGGNEENADPGKRKVRKKSKDEASFEDEEDEDEETEEEEASEGGSSYSSEESEPEVPERKYRSRRLALRQAQRSSRRKERQRHKRRKAGRRSGGGTSPEVEIYAKRTCRTRSNVSYQFKEFDELISNAIEDDKPCPRERKPGRSTGKDMSNILGASDEEDEKIRLRDGDSSCGGGPPGRAKRKSKRKLTKLDSDESDQEDDESEEFKLSEEDSEATEIEGEEDEEEEEEEEEINSSDSGAWKPKKTWYNSRSVRRPKKSRFVAQHSDSKDQLAARAGEDVAQTAQPPPFQPHGGPPFPGQYQGQMRFPPQGQPPHAHSGQPPHLRYPPLAAVSQGQAGGPDQRFNNPAMLPPNMRPGMASPPHYASSGPGQAQQQMMGSYPQRQPHQGYMRGPHPGIEPGQIVQQSQQPQQAHSHHLMQQQQRMMVSQPGLQQGMRPPISGVGNSTPPHSSPHQTSGPAMPPPGLMQQQNPRMPPQTYRPEGSQQHQQLPRPQVPPQNSDGRGSPPYHQQQQLQYQQPPQNFIGPNGRMPAPREMGPGYYGMHPPLPQGGIGNQRFQHYGPPPPTGAMNQGFQGMSSPLNRMGQMTRNLGPNSVQGMNAGSVEPGPMPEKRPSLGSPPQHSEGLGDLSKSAEGPKHPKLEQRDTKSPEKQATRKRGPRGKRGAKQESSSAAAISPPAPMPKQGQGVPQGATQGPGLSSNPGISHGVQQNPPMKQGSPTNQAMQQVPPVSQGMPQRPPPNQGTPQGPPSHQGMHQGPPPNPGLPQGVHPDQSLPRDPQSSQGIPPGLLSNPGVRQGAPLNQGMPQSAPHQAGSQHRPYMPATSKESTVDAAALSSHQEAGQGSNVKQEGGGASPASKEDKTPQANKQADKDDPKAPINNDTKPPPSSSPSSNVEQTQQQTQESNTNNDKQATVSSPAQQTPPQSTQGTPTSVSQGLTMPPYTSHGNLGPGNQPAMYYNTGPYNSYPYGQSMAPPPPHAPWGPNNMPSHGGPMHRFGPGMYSYNMGGPDPHHLAQHAQGPRMPPANTPSPHHASPGATPPHSNAPRNSRTSSTESQHNSEPEAQPSSQSMTVENNSQNQPVSLSTSQAAVVKSQAPPPSSSSFSSQSQLSQTSSSSPAHLATAATAAVEREPTSAAITSADASSSSPVASQRGQPSSTAPQPASSGPSMPASSTPQHGMPPGMPQYPPHSHYQQPGMGPWMSMMHQPYTGHGPVGPHPHPHFQAQQQPVMHPGFHPGFDQNRFQGNGIGAAPPGYGRQYQGGTPPSSEPSPAGQPHKEAPPYNPGKDSNSDGNTAAPKSKKAKTQKKPSSGGKDGAATAGRGKGAGKGRGRGGRGGFMIDNLLHTRREGEEEEEGENSGDINDIASYVATDEYFKQQTSS
ncbi:chromosome alignment-maintaining phosphoprotein 1 [Plakobranchus ocellatus]|uniref:Chromosome alignment-maintaining phosphoprotein 1 n=1 Tax=Plakobranchus ocellatus TaxID=259542 RepID=A0AAV3XZ45_9GAST|nr:chromosome alignment-maintaining phosphoprotein 1 [Plakobranchus ocellatus]